MEQELNNDEKLRRALSYRWVIFWILAFGYVLVYFHRLCPAVVAVDMMKDLNAGGALIGFLSAAYFYPYALMQLPAGLLSDTWGPRKTITLFFIIAFAGSVILGFATSVSLAILGRTLVGIGIAMLFVATMKVLAEWFKKTEFAMMTGILMAMGGLGSLTATVPLALLSGWIGWRFSFIFVGILTLLLAVLIWFFVYDRPEDRGWPSPAEHTGDGTQSIKLSEGVKKVISSPSFWPLAVWFFFDCGIFFSFGGLWGGPYLMQVYGMTKPEAGRILSMLAIGMVIGSPLLSYLSNNLFHGRKPVIVVSSAVVLVITYFMAFHTEGISVFWHYTLCLGLGIFSSAIVVIGFTATKELFPVQMAGTAIGLVNLFPFAGGAVFQPVLGYILERQGRVEGAFTVAGYKSAFLILFCCGIIAFLSSFFIKETMSKNQSPQVS